MGSIEISIVSAGADSSVFGAAWYGASAGVYQYDSADGVWIARNELPPDSGITLNGIYAGTEANLWATGNNQDGTEPKLYRWDAAVDGWTEVASPVSNDHSALPIPAADGTVWLYTMLSDGSGGKALWRYEADGSWTAVENADPESIWAVSIADAGAIWSIRNDASAKLYKYDAKLGWQEHSGPKVDSGYRSLYLCSLAAAPDGTLVVAGHLYNSPSDWKAACWLRAPGSEEWVEMPQPSGNQVQSVSAGSANDIWGVGTQLNFSVYRWDPQQKQWKGVITSDVPAATVIEKVRANVLNMIQLNDKYHDYFQDHISELYNLMQVNDTDPGQTLVTNMVRLSFKAVAAAPFPGAGAVSGVLSGVFDWMVADRSGDLNKLFADVWARFSKNSLYLRSVLSEIHDDVAGYWGRAYTNPESGEITKVADLFESEMPGESQAKPFNDLLQRTLTAGKLSLWRQVLPTKWHNVSMINAPKLWFKTREEANAWIEGYVNKNENYYITVVQQGSKYYVNEHWLGYGPFPLGHHEAPASLCEALFTDDGVGKVVRPDSVATRAEVFEHWGLESQKVVMPSQVAISSAASSKTLSLTDALLAGVSADSFAQLPRADGPRAVGVRQDS